MAKKRALKIVEKLNNVFYLDNHLDGYEKKIFFRPTLIMIVQYFGFFI